MELIADFLLLAASMCACFYCWLLSQRLRKLKSTRNGIAASLASLSKSVEEAKTTIAHSHLAAEASIEKLGPMVQEAQRLQAELNAAIQAQQVFAQTASMNSDTISVAPTPNIAPQPAPQPAPTTAPAPVMQEPAAPVQVNAAPPEADDVSDDNEFEIEWNDPVEAGDNEPVDRDVIALEGATA